MGKTRIGTIKQMTLIEGDINLLSKNEILVSKDEGYTILQKRTDNDNIETYIVVPLKDFTNGTNIRQKMENS